MRKRSLILPALLLVAMGALSQADLIQTRSNPVGDGTMAVDTGRGDWSGLTAFNADPDDAPAGETDWQAVTIAHDSSSFYIRYLLHDGPGLNFRYNMLIDTDQNRGTGYIGDTSQFAVGAEYMVQGATLFQYTGSGTDWFWSDLGLKPWDESIANDVEIGFDQADIGSPESFDFVLWGDNATTDDMYDDTGAGGGSGGYFEYTTNIPEPSTAALVGLSLLAMLRLRRRRG